MTEQGLAGFFPSAAMGASVVELVSLLLSIGGMDAGAAERVSLLLNNGAAF